MHIEVYKRMADMTDSMISRFQTYCNVYNQDAQILQQSIP